MRILTNLFTRDKTQAILPEVPAAPEVQTAKSLQEDIVVKSVPLDLLFAGLPFTQDASYEIRAYSSLIYYEKCSTIASAIDWIAPRFADMTPRVFDKKAKKYIDHEVLELLERPFGDMLWPEFALQTAIYFLVAGNNYMVATGNVAKPPLEICNIHPASISIVPGNDGYADKMIATVYTTSIDFNRDEKSGYFRFIDNLGMRELWQIKGFHPRSQMQANLYGMSPINPIYKEIEQVMQANNHNLYLLMNQGKLSLVFTVGERQLPKENYDRMVDQIKKRYSGAENTGKVTLLEGGMDVKEVGMTNTDMDFLNLKKELKNDIYIRLKIPLALVSTEALTYDNIKSSMLLLYDNAIIPLANRIFRELTAFLMPRYKGSENLQITYNPHEVPALMDRIVSQIADKSKAQIYMINELRNEAGLEDAEGGDNIFIPATNQPIANLVDPPDAQQDYIDALNNNGDKKPNEEPKDKKPKADNDE